MSPTHLAFVSGGVGSYIAAKRVKRQHPNEPVLFLFTDTRSEDKDCYRFLIESVAAMTVGLTPAVERSLALCKLLPEGPSDDYRHFVEPVHSAACEALPDLVWLADGRDLWTLFNDENYIGNRHLIDHKDGIPQAEWVDNTCHQEECPVDRAGHHWANEYLENHLQWMMEHGAHTQPVGHNLTLPETVAIREHPLVQAVRNAPVDEPVPEAK